MLPEAVNTFSQQNSHVYWNPCHGTDSRRPSFAAARARISFGYIRPRVDVLTQDGTVRKLKRIPLGLVRGFDLSQGKLARILGIGQAQLSRYELGQSELTLTVLLRLTLYSAKSLDWILWGEAPGQKS